MTIPEGPFMLLNSMPMAFFLRGSYCWPLSPRQERTSQEWRHARHGQRQ